MTMLGHKTDQPKYLQTFLDYHSSVGYAASSCFGTAAVSSESSSTQVIVQGPFCVGMGVRVGGRPVCVLVDG